MTTAQRDPSDGIAISAENVQFRWRGPDAFGFNLSAFTVQRGETVFLMGPSGSGKSTLLSLLCGISLPASGRLQVLETDMGSLSRPRRDRFRANHIGIIFQLFNLLPYSSVADNIKLSLSFSPIRKQRVGSEPQIDVEVERLLSALDLPPEEFADRPAAKLSVGQQQRVAAARALIGAPEIIIADEPTSALDTSRQTQFVELLSQELQKSGSTLILAGHDERLAPSFDRVIVLPDILRRLA